MWYKSHTFELSHRVAVDDVPFVPPPVFAAVRRQGFGADLGPDAGSIRAC